MFKNKLVFLFFSLPLIAASILIALPPEGEKEAKLEEALTPQMMQLLSAPEEVALYDPVGERIVLTRQQTDRLKNLIGHDESYLFELSKSVMFFPNAGFLFVRGEERLLLQVSFDAKKVKFQHGGAVRYLDADPKFKEIRAFIEELRNA